MYSAHMKGVPQVPNLGDKGSYTTGTYRTPTTLGHATRQHVIAVLPNTWKQNSEAAKMRRQRNMACIKEHIKTVEKGLNKMEVSNLSDAEFKTLVIGMLKELSEDLTSVKKIQSETENILIKIKSNLQENNSTVDEAEVQINDLEHKEAKNNQSEEQEEKRMQNIKNKKQDHCKEPLGQLQAFQHPHHRGAKRRRERARNWTFI